jgi:hypothetical protein
MEKRKAREHLSFFLKMTMRMERLVLISFLGDSAPSHRVLLQVFREQIDDFMRWLWRQVDRIQRFLHL